MKTVYSIRDNARVMENVVAVCGAIPQGDELPQVAGEEDILIDAYSDIMNMPREMAAACFHHQYEIAHEDRIGIIH